MTLQQLEYVIALDRYRHFAKAAEHCNVTQPTLSSMVQKLEDELGIKIFDRRSQPLKPTSAGKNVIDMSVKIIGESRRLSDLADELKNSMERTFVIGILPTIAPYLIPRFFPMLMKRYPKADIRIREMKTEEIKTALQNGDIDAGILAEMEGLDAFNRTTLFYERFYSYVAKDEALYAKERIKTIDLKGEYLWLLDEGHCFRDQLVRFCNLKSATTSKKAYTLGSIETFMRIVESGKGVTFIPELAISQLSHSQLSLVKPFAIPVPTRQLVFMTNKDFVRQQMQELIVNEVRASVPKEMLTMDSTRLQL